MMIILQVALCGLKPEVILEVCSRAINFWNYQVNKKNFLLCYHGMIAFLYTEGIQLTAAHSNVQCSNLTQDEVQHLWRYNLYSQG